MFLICYSIVYPYLILLLAYAFYPFIVLLYRSDPSYYHPVSLILSYCSSLYLLNVSDVFPYYFLLYVIYYIAYTVTDISYGIPAHFLSIISHSFPIVFLIYFLIISLYISYIFFYRFYHLFSYIILIGFLIGFAGHIHIYSPIVFNVSLPLSYTPNINRKEH